MSDEVVHGLSAEAKRIPSKWNRQTVADGSWLQKYTLNPLSARDVYLAEQIDKGTSALSAAISAEEARAISAESALQSQIDTLEAATDVIMVYGTYSAFSSTSGALWENPGYLTENDVIKVLVDDSDTNSANQTYYQATQVDHDTSSCTWTKIGELDPYYNKTEIDEYFEALSGSISSNYYASGNIIASGNLSATHVNSTNEPPKIVIDTKDKVTFNSVTASSLSSQSAIAINLSSNNISATNISATKLSASTAYGQSAKFDNISATNLTALTAQGNSARFDNINATNLTANNISSTNLTALTAQGHQASYTNISATTLSGATTSINIDNLINAATAGAVAYSGENGIYVTAHKIGLSGDYLNAIASGSAASAWVNTHKDKVAYVSSFNGNGGVITGYGTSAFAGGISSISAKGTSTALFTGYNVSLSAGPGIGFVNGNNLLSISSNDTTYAASSYISTANNTITVTGGIIGSAQSGKVAWDILSGTKISAVGTSFANTGFGNLSAGFRISAGNNLTISTAANNTIQLNSKDTGITSISAKNGSSTAKFTGPNISFSAGAGVGFNTNTANIITISAEGKTYSDGRFIQISGTNNSINVTDGLVNSSKSGWSAYDWITTKSATLSAGPGIGFFSAGQNILGISAEGTSYTTGRGIAINGTVISVKDEFVPWSASEINLPNTSNTALNTAFSHGLNNTANSASFAQGLENSANTYSIAQGKDNKAYNCAQAFGYNNIIVGGMAIGQNNKTSADVAFVIGNGTNENRSDLFLISGNGDIHMAGKSIKMSYGNSNTTISLTGVSRGTMSTSLEVNWSDLVGKNFVYASTNASGSILSANNKVTLVVTSTLPTQIPSGHYFIV